MSFKATLFINGEERTILDASLLYHILTDSDAKPTSRLFAKPLSFGIESTRFDSFFYQQMFSPTQLCEGEIVFYKRDGFSTLFKIEFANAHITHLSEQFTSEGVNPMKLDIEISWGIIRMKGLVYEQPWNPYNPFLAQAAPTVIEKKEPKIIDCYYTDTEGNEAPELTIGDDVYLVLKTENMVGEVLDVDLSNHSKDFEYNGAILDDDTLKNITINSDLKKIPLKIIMQQKSPVKLQTS